MKQLLKSNYQDFMIIVTFFLFWISIQFGEVIEDTIAYIFVLSLGIIHGANDLNILQKKKTHQSTFLKSLSIYLFIILCCVISYWIAPILSILTFILLSAYHFGEQHLEKKVPPSFKFKGLIYILYGLVIFALLFHENITDVNMVLLNLADFEITVAIVRYAVAISFMGLVSFLIFLHYKSYDLKMNYFKELLYLFVLFLVFKTSSLIFGFAVYFVFWHSIPSIADQIRYLFGKHSTTAVTSYFKAAFFYWILSIISLIIGYYILDAQLFNSALFLILFAVTAPHTWVMKRMKE